MDDFSNRHFLIVEDDCICKEFFFEALSLYGSRVTFADTGEQAVEIIKQGNTFDLILMDICLPGMDGYEATRKIHNIAPSIPIIAQTAYVVDVQEQASRRAGCIGFIAKPIKLEELCCLIRKVLASNQLNLQN